MHNVSGGQAHYCHRITLGELLLLYSRERGGREQIGHVRKWRNGNPIPKWQQFDLGDEEESGRKKYRLTSTARRWRDVKLRRPLEKFIVYHSDRSESIMEAGAITVLRPTQHKIKRSPAINT
jgi:hypothetical protein